LLKERFKHYRKVISSTSFKILVWRLYRKILEVSGDALRNSKIIRKSYFLSDRNFFKLLQIKGNSNACIDLLEKKIDKNLFLNSIIRDTDKKFIISKLSRGEKNKIIELADEICRHKFDLLGSGRVKISYSSKPKGVEGYKYNMNINSEEIKKCNLKIRNKVNSLFNDSKISVESYRYYDYESIDWHIDFKSGYRWDKNIWYRKIKVGQLPGVDIKVPWELSRFYHLITLAQAYILTKNERYTLEYIYQIIDWIENNRPQLGVNWKCTMDVAIRAANWVLSLSFFKDSEFFTKEFLFYFSKNIYLHGRHIINNLEYQSITSNHYLSDIAGLLFVSGLFEGFGIGKKWRNFSIKELINEIEKQVYQDGVDFEAATCYHRLVLELLFYPLLYLVKSSDKSENKKNYLEVGEDIFGKRYLKKLYNMFVFVLHGIKPDKNMPQIGDNDNGRFLRFGIRESLDMSYLTTLGAIFFSSSIFNVKEFGFCPEALWIFGKDGYDIWHGLNDNTLKNISSMGFKNAGCYVMRNNGSYMIISAGPNGQNGNGGHAHNDKLSFELFLNSESIIVDPGTFLYTPLPKMRNKFRSTSYHNTAVVDEKEQNEILENNLFALGNNAIVQVKSWSSSEKYDLIEAEHSGYKRFIGQIIHRRIIVFDKLKNFWIIKDIFTGEGKHYFDIYFHFNSCINGCGIDDSMVANAEIGKNVILKIIPLIKDGLRLKIIEGWHSPGYGNRDRNLVVKYSRESVVPAEFIFVLSLDNFKHARDYVDSLINKLKTR